MKNVLVNGKIICQYGWKKWYASELWIEGIARPVKKCGEMMGDQWTVTINSVVKMMKITQSKWQNMFVCPTII